jgi:hypothetical protein
MKLIDPDNAQSGFGLKPPHSKPFTFVSAFISICKWRANGPSLQLKRGKPQPSTLPVLWRSAKNPKMKSALQLATKKFLATKRAEGKPGTKTGTDGRPMKLSKNDHCVVDMKKL